VFAFNVLAKCHLQQRESHVECLNDVGLTRQWMVASGRFAAWHLSFDTLEPMQHLGLKALECRVQDGTADPIHFAAHLKYIIQMN
jgi:hypothetical protein